MIHPSGEGRLYPLQPPCEMSCSLAGFPYLTAHLVVQQIQRSWGRATGVGTRVCCSGPDGALCRGRRRCGDEHNDSCVMGLGWLLMLRGTEQWIRAVAMAVSF